MVFGGFGGLVPPPMGFPMVQLVFFKQVRPEAWMKPGWFGALKFQARKRLDLTEDALGSLEVGRSRDVVPLWCSLMLL